MMKYLQTTLAALYIIIGIVFLSMQKYEAYALMLIVVELRNIQQKR